MASNDTDAKLDFSLVSTYIPGILLLVRSLFLVILYQIFVVALSHNSGFSKHGAHLNVNLILCGMVVLVYFDAWWHRHDALNKSCGFLGPVLLCIATTSDTLYRHGSPCTDITSTLLYYILGTVWAASSGFFVVNSLIRFNSCVNVYHASLVWAGVLCLLLFIDCPKKSVYEICVRVCIFYGLVIMVWFSQAFQPDLERTRFAYTILHVHLHILFVDRYIVLGSIVIWAGAFAFQRQSIKQSSLVSASTSHRHASDGMSRADPVHAVDESILLQLQAAKRAGGLV